MMLEIWVMDGLLFLISFTFIPGSLVKRHWNLRWYSSEKRYDVSSFQSSTNKKHGFLAFWNWRLGKNRSLTSIENKLSDYLVVTWGTQGAVSAYKLVTRSIALFHHLVVPNWRHVWSEPQLPYIHRAGQWRSLIVTDALSQKPNKEVGNRGSSVTSRNK